MKEKVRFCILCGQKIGEQPFCTNPECESLPNYYRHVPGPNSRPLKRVKRDRRPVTGASAVRRHERKARAHHPRLAVVTAETGDDRRTLPIQAGPVAVLFRRSRPHERHPILPGVSEVGARPPAQIIINRPEVSSRHARIECRKGRSGKWHLTIVDRGSTNGSYVNGERVVSRRELETGDHIRFANVDYEIRFLGTEEPRVTVAL